MSACVDVRHSAYKMRTREIESQLSEKISKVTGKTQLLTIRQPTRFNNIKPICQIDARLSVVLYNVGLDLSVHLLLFSSNYQLY